MHAILVIEFALVALASGKVYVPIKYHDKVGIPEARKIKVYEDAIMSNPKTRPSDDLGRIVGGSPAPVNSHPYLGGLVISLVGSDDTSVCGSSLVSPNRLVTAAHCWYDGAQQAWKFTVVLGSQFLYHGGTRIDTSIVVVHPKYFYFTLHNDIAVIYLPTSVTYTIGIYPVDLPNSLELSESFVGEWAVAAGYGVTSDHQLIVPVNMTINHVAVQVIPPAECYEIYPDRVIDSTICTSGKGRVGTCRGDSGGPLVINRAGRMVLIGVSSFVRFIDGKFACQLGDPSGFTRVASYDNFIRSHTD